MRKNKKDYEGKKQTGNGREKKPYKTPRLMELGSVKELTQGGQFAISTDGSTYFQSPVS